MQSQALQDEFVVFCLNAKREGTFVDIGAGDPIQISNTYALETRYGWRGCLVDMDASRRASYEKKRPRSEAVMRDSTSIDYGSLFRRLSFPAQIDYLSLDVDDASLSTLKKIEADVLDDYKFSVVTFEHDSYRLGDDLRGASRGIFLARGYVLAAPDIRNDGYPFEDWWVSPEVSDRINVLQESLEGTEALRAFRKQ